MARIKQIVLPGRSHLGKIMLALFGLGVAFIVSLLLFIRTETFENWVKGKINQWIVENIDGKVEIGTLGFELVPPRVFAENVSVFDKKGTKFLTCERIEILPDPISLLKRDINFDEIALTSPSINLIMDNGRITNLPALKRPSQTEGKKPVVETLTILNGDVKLQASKTAPWDVQAQLSSISLDVTGEENIVFEVRLLTGEGKLKLGDVEIDVNRIETRTTLETTDEFQKLKIKLFNLDAGEVELALKKSEISLHRDKGPVLTANFHTASPLPMVSKLTDRVPELKGYESCDGMFSYGEDNVAFDAVCNIENLWVSKYEVGTLSSHIIYKDDHVEFKDSKLTGGGGALTFDAAVDLKGKKELTFAGNMDGMEISKIFQQLGDRKCGAKFHGYGPVSLSGTLDPVFLKGEMNTEVKGFRIFTGHHAKPTSKEVLNIPRGHVHSNLEITDKYFRFKNGSVKVQNTTVTTDVKLNFDKTLDISISSPKFNGVDIKTISRVPIKGSGKLKCSIKGKMKDPTVSGSATLASFAFAGVNFGNVDFQLLYKGNRTILLPEVRAKKGQSKYSISDGQIVFRSRKQGGILVEGDVHASTLYLSDLLEIFAVQSRLLDKIEAKSEGSLAIRYEPDAKKTTVNADLDLSGISVFGENFEQGKLKGEWNTEDINVQSLKMWGKLGQVEIIGRKGTNDSLDFDVVLKDIDSSHMKLADFNSLGIGFVLSTTTRVQGTLDMPVVDNAVVDVRSIRFGKISQPASTVVLNLRNNVLTLTGDLMDNAILWKSITDLNKDGASEVVVEINDLTLDHMEMAKITGKLTDSPHSVTLSGSLKATGRLWDKFKVDGSGSFSKMNMTFSGYDLVNSSPIQIGFTHQSLTFKQVQFKGEGTRLKITGGLSKKGPAISLQGEVDLNLLKKFTDEIQAADGHVSPRLLLSGKWEKPYFLGEMGIACDTLRLKTGSLKFSEVTGNMSLDHNTVAINLGGSVSGGEFLASGTMQMEALKPVSYELYAEFNDLNVRLIKGVPIGLEGALTLSRNVKIPGLPKISGEVRVTSLRYTKDFILSQQVEDIVTKPRGKDVKVYDKRDEKFALDITIHGSNKLSVKNNIADAQFRVDESQKPFKVIGTDILPVFYGTVVVHKGNVMWKGRTFDLDRGIIDFTNPAKTEPHFDILASGEVKQWRIQLQAMGTPDDFTVLLSSEPELPEEDILLLIQFGMTREEMAKIENAQAVAAEITSQAIGLDTQIKRLIPIIDQFQITSEFSKQTNKVEPRVSVGKKLSDQIKLSAVSGLTDTESLEKGTYFKAVVEYKVTDSLSIQAQYDNLKGPEVGQESQQFGNVGVDIKWRIEF